MFYVDTSSLSFMFASVIACAPSLFPRVQSMAFVIFHHSNCLRNSPSCCDVMHFSNLPPVLAFVAQLDGIKLDTTDSSRQTAMHLAARGRHAQAVFLLLELGGVQLAERGDAEGTTALQIAAMLGEVEILRVLIQV